MAQDKERDFDTSGLSSPYLNALLFKHILLKGVEVGSFVGLFCVAPIVYYRTAKPVDPVILGRALGRAAIIGPALSGSLGVARVSTIDHAGLEDRVYRLNYNEEQNRWDKFAIIGMMGGAALAAFGLGQQPWIIAGGAAVGCSVGTIAHISTWKSRKEIGKQMIEELKVPVA